MSRRLSTPTLYLPAFAVLLMASGCPPSHDDHPHGPDDHGEAEEKTEAITVFSDRHELFIEHAFLLRGQRTRFITHVTDIIAREARSDGPVTFVLQLGDGQPIEQVVPEVARLGIYLPEITFPEAGEWQVALRIPTAGGDDLVPLPNRTVFATQADIDAAPEVEGADGISFLKEQQWKLDFEVVPVVRTPLVERLQLPGRLSLPASGRAEVSAPVGGRYLATESGEQVSLGEHVESGQVLARVQPPLAGADHLSFLSSRQQFTALRLDLETNAVEALGDVSLAQVTFEFAEQQVVRVRELAAVQAKSAREVEQAENQVARAETDLRAARARHQLYSDMQQRLGELPIDLSQGFPTIEVRSPIAGVVVEATHSVGEHLAAGEALFTVLDRTMYHLQVLVPETALERLPAEPDVVFATPGQRRNFRPVLGEGGGRLLLPAMSVDPASRAARLVYELPSPGDLAAGMTVEAFVATRTPARRRAARGSRTPHRARHGAE